MENKAIRVSLKKNKSITVKAIPGHFTTSNAHVNYYLDGGALKSNAAIARSVARTLVTPYVTSALVDTIICMERTDVIGAFMADEFLRDGTGVMNAGRDIHVARPMYNTSGKLIFQDNVVEWIAGHNVILLVNSISSGRTVNSALECISYYGGNVVGISSLFTVLPSSLEPKPNSLFTSDDIPDFKIYSPSQCELCQKGRRLDALVSSDGYTRL
jgi:orotate phosphoribosyltransferase